MKNETKKVLVITQDADVSKHVGAALSSQSDIKLQIEEHTLPSLNGKAMEMACKHDIVMFTTNPKSEQDVDAIRTLANGNTTNTVFIALTPGDISLAEARELNKAGANDVLPYQTSETDLCEQVHNWTDKVQSTNITFNSSAASSGKIITVAQARGGIGSTTVAVNLADQLLAAKGILNKEARNKVALVDLDFQFGTIGSFLDIKEQDGLLQLASDGATPDKTFLKQAMVTLPSGLAVLTAPSKFAPIDALKSHQVAAILDTLKAEYDYVIVDLPRALVEWLNPILDRTDKLFLVTDTLVPSIRQSRRLIDFFSECNLALSIEMLVNFEHRPLFLAQHHKEASKVLEREFKHWLPYDLKAAQTAVDHGKPISYTSPRSKLGRAFKTLAKETIKTFPATHRINKVA
ncbi:MAG: AAA family ATPase [Amylibacter sp.]